MNLRRSGVWSLYAFHRVCTALLVAGDEDFCAMSVAVDVDGLEG